MSPRPLVRIAHAYGNRRHRLELALAAGVDLIETDAGLKIVEVNTGGEFRCLLTTTEVDIAAEIVAEAIRTAERGVGGRVIAGAIAR